MKKYIPVDFDEKGKVVLGRERNTPTSNGFIPTTWVPGGGDEGKQGLKSITISPAITTTPALDTLLPADYDTLIEQGYEPQPGSGILLLLNVDPSIEGNEYSVTVTPTSDWYAVNPNDWTFGGQGEPVSYTITASFENPLFGAVGNEAELPPEKLITVAFAPEE